MNRRETLRPKQRKRYSAGVLDRGLHGMWVQGWRRWDGCGHWPGEYMDGSGSVWCELTSAWCQLSVLLSHIDIAITGYDGMQIGKQAKSIMEYIIEYMTENMLYSMTWRYVAW